MSEVRPPRATRAIVHDANGTAWGFVYKTAARAAAVVVVTVRYFDARAAAARYLGCAALDCRLLSTAVGEVPPEGWAAWAARRNAEVDAEERDPCD